MAKFLEKDYTKVKKLCQLRADYARRVGAVDEEIKLEKRMMDEDEFAEREDEWFSRRLDGGLFCLQMVDTILAWLVAEDAGAKEKIVQELGGLGEVKASLEEMVRDADQEDGGDENREMLETLVGFLD